MEKKPHTFRVNPQLIKVLKILAVHEGVSMSELLEEAIVFYIKANYPHLLKTADLEQEDGSASGGSDA
ncbi:MAG: ribbon-helix-helix domain-containing protein [Thermus sp.]